jgi:hypothetical protein
MAAGEVQKIDKKSRAGSSKTAAAAEPIFLHRGKFNIFALVWIIFYLLT